MDDNPKYILEEKWGTQWFFTFEHTDMENVIRKMEYINNNLGKYIKFEFRIREKNLVE